MRIRVLFFGVVGDIVGCRQEAIDLPAGSTVGSVFDHYAGRFPQLGASAKSLVLALNEHFSSREEALKEGDEVAFLPPVSGGTGLAPGMRTAGWPTPLREIEDPEGHYFALTRDPLNARALVHYLQRGEDGAVVTFEGVTRNNTKGRATKHLDYECYEGMALNVMAQIGREIIGAAQPSEPGKSAPDQIGKIGIVHRLGRLQIGEASVVIVVSSPHRKVAFDAAFEAINRLKRFVPIWKKETFADGEVWVEGAWDDSVIKAGS